MIISRVAVANKNAEGSNETVKEFETVLRGNRKMAEV